MDKTCRIVGCDAKVKAKELCARHYQRLLKYKDPEYYPTKRTYTHGASNMLASTGGCEAYDEPNPDSVFARILKYGNDDGFEPNEPDEPTDELPGSLEKIEAMRNRLDTGQSLWHDDDRLCYEGLSRTKMRVTRGGW